MTTLTLSPAALAIAAPFMAKKDVRYYLNGALVEANPAGGAFVVATDGHALIVVRDAAAVVPADTKLILPRDFVAAVLKHAGTSPVALTLGDELAVTFAARGMTLSDTLIDGRFPDWRAVVPASPLSGDEATFNPDLIARIAKSGDGARKHAGAGKYVGMKLIGNGADRSSAFAMTGLHDGLSAGGVIMPLREACAPGRDDIGRVIVGN